MGITLGLLGMLGRIEPCVKVDWVTAIFITVPGVCWIHVPVSRNVTGQVTQGSNLLTHPGDVVIGGQRGNELDELVLKD